MSYAIAAWAPHLSSTQLAELLEAAVRAFQRNTGSQPSQEHASPSAAGPSTISLASPQPSWLLRSFLCILPLFMRRLNGQQIEDAACSAATGAASSATGPETTQDSTTETALDTDLAGMPTPHRASVDSDPTTMAAHSPSVEEGMPMRHAQGSWQHALSPQQLQQKVAQAARKGIAMGADLLCGQELQPMETLLYSIFCEPQEGRPELPRYLI